MMDFLNVDSETTIITFARHGQSQTNVENTVSGHLDTPLTEKGHKQGKMLAKALKNRHFDKVYSSDLSRAYDTTKYIADLQGKEIIKDRNLRELNLGKWEGMSIEDIISTFGQEYTVVWKKDFGKFYAHDGESTTMLYNRITAFAEKIAKENKGKSILFGTHACVIRVFFGGIMGLFPDKIDDYPWATNASYSTAVYKNGKWEVLEYSVDDFMQAELKSQFEG